MTRRPKDRSHWGDKALEAIRSAPKPEKDRLHIKGDLSLSPPKPTPMGLEELLREASQTKEVRSLAVAVGEMANRLLALDELHGECSQGACPDRAALDGIRGGK